MSVVNRARRGSWVNFELRDPNAKVVNLAQCCISTSSEAAGHFQTVRSTGRIVGINDTVKASPQTVQDGSGQAQE